VTVRDDIKLLESPSVTEWVNVWGPTVDLVPAFVTVAVGWPAAPTAPEIWTGRATGTHPLPSPGREIHRLMPLETPTL
jgi:hypothetical protein